MVFENQPGADVATEAARVLIVEDDADACEAIRDFLRSFGHHAIAAKSGKEALRRAANARPDVVVCDWQLGQDDDGVDVAKKLQRRYGSRIIFITAHRLSALREATRDLDIELFLQKPISLHALSRAIDAMAR